VAGRASNQVVPGFTTSGSDGQPIATSGGAPLNGSKPQSGSLVSSIAAASTLAFESPSTSGSLGTDSTQMESPLYRPGSLLAMLMVRSLRPLGHRLRTKPCMPRWRRRSPGTITMALPVELVCKLSLQPGCNAVTAARQSPLLHSLDPHVNPCTLLEVIRRPRLRRRCLVDACPAHKHTERHARRY